MWQVEKWLIEHFYESAIDLGGDCLYHHVLKKTSSNISFTLKQEDSYSTMRNFYLGLSLNSGVTLYPRLLSIKLEKVLIKQNHCPVKYFTVSCIISADLVQPASFCSKTSHLIKENSQDVLKVSTHCAAYFKRTESSASATSVLRAPPSA